MTQLAVLTKALWRRWMLWIPIRILSAKHRPKIATHLKSLGTQDRYLRFGYPATDEQIENYVSHLNFERDDIYGVFNRRLEILAMAHLAADNLIGYLTEGKARTPLNPEVLGMPR